jgi:hypothetical protein
MATYATLNSNAQTQCGRQLRTFDKTMRLAVQTYTRGQWTGGTAYRYPRQGSTSAAITRNYYHRYEYVGASYSVYNGYLDGGIYTGQLIHDDDVYNTISRVVRRTVDLIEGRFTQRNISALVCHSSCHGSCHSSRGRR